MKFINYPFFFLLILSIFLYAGEDLPSWHSDLYRREGIPAEPDYVEPPLFRAIMQNDLKTVTKLATQESILTQYQLNGVQVSPLQRALGNARWEIVEYFITAFNCINIPTEELLYDLAQFNQLGLMKLIIDKGENIHKPARSGHWPLTKCVEYIFICKDLLAFIACCQLLLQHGADLTETFGEYSVFDYCKQKIKQTEKITRLALKEKHNFLPTILYSGLTYALLHNLKNRTLTLSKFYELPQALEVKDKQGNSIVHNLLNDPDRIARQAKIKFLLRHGASVNVINNAKKTVAEIAFEQNDRPLVGLLISYGANILSGSPSVFEKFIAQNDCKFLAGLLSRTHYLNEITLQY